LFPFFRLFAGQGAQLSFDERLFGSMDLDHSAFLNAVGSLFSLMDLEICIHILDISNAE